ncbi:unnamed protein product [Leuciscus chuanchicus]
MAEDLNQFYSRFDQFDYSQERKELIDELTPMISAQANLELRQEEVELMLKKKKPNKAPDQICGRLLKACCSQLADRHQRVRVNGHLSSSRIVSTGAPQGSVISPVLYTLYTNDCRSNNPGIIYTKYSDDTVIMDTTNSLRELQTEMDIFAEWCKQSCLDLNASKTKELVVDFRSSVDFRFTSQS